MKAEALSFKPTINGKSKKITRAAPVDVLLVVDAKRRAAMKSGCKSRSQIEKPEKFKPVDTHSESLIYKRFLRDLGAIYGSFGVDSESMEFNRDRTLEIFV